MAGSYKVMIFFLVIAISVSTMVMGLPAVDDKPLSADSKKLDNSGAAEKIVKKREHLKYRIDLPEPSNILFN